MNEIWNCKHFWFPKLNLFLPSTMLILCLVFISQSFLEKVNNCYPPWTQSLERIFTWFFDAADKTSSEVFWHL